MRITRWLWSGWNSEYTWSIDISREESTAKVRIEAQLKRMKERAIMAVSWDYYYLFKFCTIFKYINLIVIFHQGGFIETDKVRSGGHLGSCLKQQSRSVKWYILLSLLLSIEIDNLVVLMIYECGCDLPACTIKTSLVFNVSSGWLKLIILFERNWAGCVLFDVININLPLQDDLSDDYRKRARMASTRKQIIGDIIKSRKACHEMDMRWVKREWT